MKKVEWVKEPAGVTVFARLQALSLRIARIDLAQRAHRNLAVVKALTEGD